MICPVCAAIVGVEEVQCRACGVGLVDYATVWYLPDRLVNDGLARLRDERVAAAATLFARACALRPDDVAAHRAWAHACQRLGSLEEAAGILHDAIGDGVESDDQFAELMEALVAEGRGADARAGLPSPTPEPVAQERRAGVPVKRSRSGRRGRR